MKIKYSKFEINMWDIFFLILFLGHLLGGIDILFRTCLKTQNKQCF